MPHVLIAVGALRDVKPRAVRTVAALAGPARAVVALPPGCALSAAAPAPGPVTALGPKTRCRN